MERISSEQTAFVKWWLIPLCVAPLAVLLLLAFFFGNASEGSGGGRLLLIVAGFLLLNWIPLWNLADRVDRTDDGLVVRRGGVEDRIRLEDVSAIDQARFGRPMRLILRLRTPCRFGDKVVFIPKGAYVTHLSTKNSVLADLRERIERARART
jgi:hypothetical protein